MKGCPEGVSRVTSHLCYVNLYVQADPTGKTSKCENQESQTRAAGGPVARCQHQHPGLDSALGSQMRQVLGG